MALFPTLKPRRFSFQPRYYKPPTEGEEESPHRIQFRKITRYDSHSRVTSPIRLIIMALLIGLVIWMLGGVPEPVQEVSITIEDVAGK